MSLYTEMTTLQSNILTTAFSTFFRHFSSIQNKIAAGKIQQAKKIALIRFFRHKPKKSAERFLYTANRILKTLDALVGSTLAVN